MATQRMTFLAQPHVRPVLLGWSRWLAGGVLGLLASAISVAGLIAIAQLVMHSFVLSLLLLISLAAVALVVFLPNLLPRTPGQG